MLSDATVNEAILNFYDKETRSIHADIFDLLKCGGGVSCDRL